MTFVEESGAYSGEFWGLTPLILFLEKSIQARPILMKRFPKKGHESKPLSWIHPCKELVFVESLPKEILSGPSKFS